MGVDYFPENFLSALREANGRQSGGRAGDVPRLSIVMPSYNQERFIERSILSVLNQAYPNLQFIIIDGGSTDRTVDIIRKYEDYLDYWVSEPDNGQSDALNKGFARADGEIYGWLNSDDLYLPGALMAVVDVFRQHPGKMVVFGDWLSIGESDELLDMHHAFDFCVNHFKYEGFHLNAQSMFWRHSAHERFSGFEQSLYNTMDYQMILEFGINEGSGSFMRLPRVLGAFRRYEGQKTAGFTERVLAEHRYMAERYGYMDKYEIVGKYKRLLYRFRRAYWYVKRGGLSELASRLWSAYG